MSDPEEEDLADLLATGLPDHRLFAARELWRGHSRRQAANVVRYVASLPPGAQESRDLKLEIDAALESQAILRELKEGDYLWATWLAFLRPHPQLVPTLLAGLRTSVNDKAQFLPETMIALGNSRDPRALEPLLELLESKDYRIAGDAANALGYLGNAKAEPKLIEALAEGKSWLQMNACRALATIGTSKALPALEKLAKNGLVGVLNVQGMARDAIEQIVKREKR